MNDRVTAELLDLTRAAEARLAHGDQARRALVMACGEAAAQGDLIELAAAGRACRILDRQRAQRLASVWEAVEDGERSPAVPLVMLR